MTAIEVTDVVLLNEHKEGNLTIRKYQVNSGSLHPKDVFNFINVLISSEAFSKVQLRYQNRENFYIVTVTKIKNGLEICSKIFTEELVREHENKNIHAYEREGYLVNRRYHIKSNSLMEASNHLSEFYKWDNKEVAWEWLLPVHEIAKGEELVFVLEK